MVAILAAAIVAVIIVAVVSVKVGDAPALYAVGGVAERGRDAVLENEKGGEQHRYRDAADQYGVLGEGLACLVSQTTAQG